MSEDDSILTIEQVAELLKICKVKAYELAHQKDFPTIKIGRSIMVSQTALYDWIEKQAIE
jgi:excisionase family DNA binding protein